MRKSIYILAIGLTISLFACSGSDSDDEPINNDTPLTNVEKIQQRWTIEHIIDHNYVGASTVIDNYDTIISGPNNFLEFRNNGLVYLDFEGDLDTGTYYIPNDSILVLDSEELKISKLSTSSLTLMYKNRVDTPYYDNVITLKR